MKKIENETYSPTNRYDWKSLHDMYEEIVGGKVTDLKVCCSRIPDCFMLQVPILLKYHCFRLEYFKGGYRFNQKPQWKYFEVPPQADKFFSFYNSILESSRSVQTVAYSGMLNDMINELLYLCDINVFKPEDVESILNGILSAVQLIENSCEKGEYGHSAHTLILSEGIVPDNLFLLENKGLICTESHCHIIKKECLVQVLDYYRTLLHESAQISQCSEINRIRFISKLKKTVSRSKEDLRELVLNPFYRFSG